VENITLYSTEDLTTLERAFDTSPIDMPASETVEPREYVIAVDDFTQAYQNWNRDRDPMLQVQDQLSQLPIWLSVPATRKIERAIRNSEPSVELG
jgi:hypothetical protein